MDQEKRKRIDLPSVLFIVWFILWIFTLVILPRDYHNGTFFILGLIPVIGWFLVKPKRRITWFARALFGINGLDKQ